MFRAVVIKVLIVGGFRVGEIGFVASSLYMFLSILFETLFLFFWAVVNNLVVVARVVVNVLIQ